MVNFSLKGKIALITGASRGIGEAIAATLCANEAHCVLVSRKQDGLATVAAKIEESGGSAEIMACNIGYPDQVAALMKSVEEKHGGLDILVNNAAANPFFGEMIDAEERVWDKTLDVNLKAPFLLTQAAARLMKTRGGGSIVNVSSINGIRPGLFQGIYSITKAGLISMTQAFAKELARYNIRVNALLPGLTDTKFAATLTASEEILQAVLTQIPLGRIARPEEMAGAVLYLVSSAASFTTGACIVCDGGMLA